MNDSLSPAPKNVAVFVSGHGRGTNLQALLDACASGEISGRIGVVIGTRTDAPAMERARAAGVPAVTVSPRKYEEDEDGYAEALLRLLNRYDVRLICLSGYMRKLPSAVVAAYPNAILNVHPALLPLFGGKGMYGEHVHRAAIESGMKVSGCTVHFVDDQYDTGPIILQSVVPILDDDTPQTLSARVLPEEHRIYVRAVQLTLDGQLHVQGRRVFIVQNP